MTWLPVYEKRGIKPLATRKDHLGQVEVDVDKNPGKSYIAAQTWLKSSWRMWLGNFFYLLVPKEKIQQFDKAWSICAMAFRPDCYVEEEGGELLYEPAEDK